MAIEICKKSVVKAYVKTCITLLWNSVGKVFIFNLFLVPGTAGCDVSILKCPFLIFDCTTVTDHFYRIR